jgi:hypothetical protein
MADGPDRGIFREIRDVHQTLPALGVAIGGAVIAQPDGIVYTAMIVGPMNPQMLRIERKFLHLR